MHFFGYKYKLTFLVVFLTTNGHSTIPPKRSQNLLLNKKKEGLTPKSIVPSHRGPPSHRIQTWPTDNDFEHEHMNCRLISSTQNKPDQSKRREVGSTGQVSAADRAMLGKNRTTKGGFTGSIFGLTPHDEPRRTWPSWDCLQKKFCYSIWDCCYYLKLPHSGRKCLYFFFANIGRNFPS